MANTTYAEDQRILNDKNKKYDALTSALSVAGIKVVEPKYDSLEKRSPKEQQAIKEGWATAYEREAEGKDPKLDSHSFDELFKNVSDKINWDKLYKEEVPKRQEWEKNYTYYGRDVTALVATLKANKSPIEKGYYYQSNKANKEAIDFAFKDEKKPIDWENIAADIEKRTGQVFDAETLKTAVEKEAMLGAQTDLAPSKNYDQPAVGLSRSNKAMVHPEYALSGQIATLVRDPSNEEAAKKRADKLVAVVVKFEPTNWEKVSDRVYENTGKKIDGEELKQSAQWAAEREQKNAENIKDNQLMSGGSDPRIIAFNYLNELTTPGKEKELLEVHTQREKALGKNSPVKTFTIVDPKDFLNLPVVEAGKGGAKTGQLAPDAAGKSGGIIQR